MPTIYGRSLSVAGRFLLDFNMAINEKVCELLDIAPQLSFTTSYGVPSEGDEALVKECHKAIVTDYRDAIRPKHPLLDDSFTPRPYYQVYQQKFGFLPNLSILDLLFNMGNEAVLWL